MVFSPDYLAEPLTPDPLPTKDSGVLRTYLERPMSLPVKLCEHIAQDCLQAVEGTKDPQTRELLLRHALEWMQDALAALKQSRAARRTRPS